MPVFISVLRTAVRLFLCLKHLNGVATVSKNSISPRAAMSPVVCRCDTPKVVGRRRHEVTRGNARTRKYTRMTGGARSAMLSGMLLNKVQRDMTESVEIEERTLETK